MAPEVTIGKTYNEKADIWSIGIMTMQLIGGGIAITPYPKSALRDERTIKKHASRIQKNSDRLRMPEYFV